VDLTHVRLLTVGVARYKLHRGFTHAYIVVRIIAPILHTHTH
jgi:hypothetical protein